MSVLRTTQDAMDYLRGRWQEPEGLAVACVASAIVLAAIIPGIHRLYAVAASSLLIVASWTAGRRMPRFRSGRFGFLVSIFCDGDPQTLRLVRSDFIQPLRELVHEGATGPEFRVRELPQYLARRALVPDYALKLQSASHARFMLIGKTRRRASGDKERLYVDLRGAVAHRHIPSPTQQKLRTEFTRLLPTHARMDLDHELLVFELTSSIVSVVSRYVMGIATALSGDLDDAERLFEDVDANLARARSWPIGDALRKGLAKRRDEIRMTRAKLAYQQWLEGRQLQQMIDVGRHLDAVVSPAAHRADYDSLKAIHTFVASRDVKSAMAIVSSHSGDEHPAWRFTKAFLCAYQGDLQAAAKEYRRVSRVSMEPDLLSQVEDFLFWVEKSDREEHGYKIAYCLGCLNMLVKEDCASSIDDFTRFLEACPPDKYKSERARVVKWIDEMKARL